MRQWIIATGMLGTLAMPVSAGEIGDQLAQRLYDGSWSEISEQAHELCYQFETDACFGRGLFDLIEGYEALSQAMYRHGATQPNSPALDLLMGTDMVGAADRPANPEPERLTYDGLRSILDDFSRALTDASIYFQMADMDGDFVVAIDPLKVRIDLDGDGTASDSETLATLFADYNEMMGDLEDPVPPGGKTKSPPAGALRDTTVGFDNADAVWLAGYATVVGTPVELLLAHDFSDFYDAYLHRVFPQAGLPMQGHAEGGTLFMDPDSDAWFADLVAGIHTASFPVTDRERLAGVLERLKLITTLSRRNWEMILAETDDDRELVPSPAQTSLIPGITVTQDVVDAWMATLDTVDQVLDGALLLPHWRFNQGIDLKRYFETAERTDLIMLVTGQDAVPFLRDGPIADAESFAAGNAVFGDDFPLFALWFN